MNIRELERALEVAHARLEDAHARIRTQAHGEGRVDTQGNIAFTAVERRQIDDLIAAKREARARLDRARSDQAQNCAIDEMLGSFATTTHGGGSFAGGHAHGFGVRFTATDTYRWWEKNRASLAGQWTSPASELGGNPLFAATVAEGTSGIGGGR